MEVGRGVAFLVFILSSRVHRRTDRDGNLQTTEGAHRCHRRAAHLGPDVSELVVKLDPNEEKYSLTVEHTMLHDPFTKNLINLRIVRAPQ